MTKASAFFDKYKHPDWKDTTYREFLCLFTLTYVTVSLIIPSWRFGLILCAGLFHALWCYDYFIAKQI